MLVAGLLGRTPDFCWGNKSPNVGTGSASRILLRQFNLLEKQGRLDVTLEQGKPDFIVN